MLSVGILMAGLPRCDHQQLFTEDSTTLNLKHIFHIGFASTVVGQSVRHSLQ
jgi:hypothetical protein